MNFIEELRWRGMLQDITPGTEELLGKESVTGYIGFDPTSDSLHIGSLVPIMILVHFQKHGHKPIVLVGGATAMIGDPSGKAEERKPLSDEQITHNQEKIKNQLMRFLDFENKINFAQMVNNYDWHKNMRVMDFLSDIGKHITVNYMMAKDSVKNRMQTGISFTEFSYQLMQAYDFYWLFTHNNCKLQMGGSDQWGNITSGVELIRRKASAEAFAATCPLLTKTDGGKFGKTESGNVWLDPSKTSPYKFYQYWLNVSDEDASKYIRIFTTLSQPEIEELENKHKEAPHLRALQQALAKDVTVRVHSETDYQSAADASNLLFGNLASSGTIAYALKKLSEKMLLEIFDGVPQGNVLRSEIESGISIMDLLVAKTRFLPSNNDARRSLKENAISVNQKKVGENYTVNAKDLIIDRYIILRRGKKNYFLVNGTH